MIAWLINNWGGLLSFLSLAVAASVHIAQDLHENNVADKLVEFQNIIDDIQKPKPKK